MEQLGICGQNLIYIVSIKNFVKKLNQILCVEYKNNIYALVASYLWGIQF